MNFNPTEANPFSCGWLKEDPPLVCSISHKKRLWLKHLEDCVTGVRIKSKAISKDGARSATCRKTVEINKNVTANFVGQC
jgi:hypothetical protein